jgi:hypothetical protein
VSRDGERQPQWPYQVAGRRRHEFQRLSLSAGEVRFANRAVRGFVTPQCAARWVQRIRRPSRLAYWRLTFPRPRDYEQVGIAKQFGRMIVSVGIAATKHSLVTPPPYWSGRGWGVTGFQIVAKHL